MARLLGRCDLARHPRRANAPGRRVEPIPLPNDQSYPAFFNVDAYPNYGDPGPGYLGGSTASGPCGLARDENGNVVANGDDHGTWAGYFDWETNITDTSTLWQCTLFLVGNGSGYA